MEAGFGLSRAALRAAAIRPARFWLLLHRALDWTRGCIAVTDAEIDQIWSAVPDGTPVEIRP